MQCIRHKAAICFHRSLTHCDAESCWWTHGRPFESIVSSGDDDDGGDGAMKKICHFWRLLLLLLLLPLVARQMDTVANTHGEKSQNETRWTRLKRLSESLCVRVYGMRIRQQVPAGYLHKLPRCWCACVRFLLLLPLIHLPIPFPSLSLPLSLPIFLTFALSLCLSHSPSASLARFADK